MRNIIFLLWMLIMTALPCFAQVGIGTGSPAPSAMLEINSTNKGLLLPRLSMQQIKNIVSPVAGLVAYNTDQNKPCFFNGTAWMHYDNTVVLPTPGIYHPLAGGIVIYVDASGIHGIAAATADVGNGFVPYGCSGTAIPGAQFSAVGTGQSNTNAILASCTTPGIGAQLCNDLVLNGFSDWYMPSIDEVSLMYALRDSLPGISTGRYWSSTQVNATIAQIRDFGTGEILFMPPSSGRYVRAVRTF
jgi:hypothetical protein